MKFNKSTLLVIAAAATQIQHGASASGKPSKCDSIVPGAIPDSSIGVKATKLGAIPMVKGNTDAGSYNMAVGEGFDDSVLFVDQKEGLVWKWKTSSPFTSIKEIFNYKTQLPSGVDVDGVRGPHVKFNDGMFF